MKPQNGGRPVSPTLVRLGSQTQLPSVTTVEHVNPHEAGGRLTLAQLDPNAVPAIPKLRARPNSTPSDRLFMDLPPNFSPRRCRPLFYIVPLEGKSRRDGGGARAHRPRDVRGES